MSKSRRGPLTSLLLLCPVLLGIPWLTYRQHSSKFFHPRPQRYLTTIYSIAKTRNRTVTELLSCFGDKLTHVDSRINPVTNLPQLSEERILNISRYLSEDIGFRTPGTFEHAQGEAWLYEQALLAQQECQRIAKDSGRQLECEIWWQKGNGSHRCALKGTFIPAFCSQYLAFLKV